MVYLDVPVPFCKLLSCCLFLSHLDSVLRVTPTYALVLVSCVFTICHTPKTVFEISVACYITNGLHCMLKVTSMNEVPICIFGCDDIHPFIHIEEDPIASGEIIVVIVVAYEMLDF